MAKAVSRIGFYLLLEGCEPDAILELRFELIFIIRAI